MKQECIEAVAQAIGRSITQKEAQGIEQRIGDAKRQLAHQDRQAYLAMSSADRDLAAADLAGQQLIHEASKAKQRVALTVLSHQRLMTEYSDLVALGHKPFSAIGRILERVGADQKGVAQEYFSSLMDTIHAAEPRFFGMIEDARAVGAIMKEIFGEDSGSPAAKKAAKAWLETIEAMRQRFNRAGGDIGKLDYGYVPQNHDALRVSAAGADKWVALVLSLLDRKRYLNEDGSLWSAQQLDQFLREAHKTISTGGLNKLEPGKFSGSGMMANRHGESRAIHFADAESFLKYSSEFGKGGLFGAMQAHVGRLASDIALVEAMSPNPALQFKFLHDTARATGATDLVGPWLVQTKNMWDSLTGITGHPENVRMAEIGQGIRNIEVFSKLSGAFLSSVTDVPTYFITTRFNKLPLFDSVKNLILAFGSDSKDFANRGGLVAESIISDMNRWAEGNIGKGWTGKIANATMKLSLLEAWTDAVRRGFSLTMMGGLGKLSRTDWHAIGEADRARLTAGGISETEFKIWNLAKTEDWRGSEMLTPQSIRDIPDATLAAAGLTQRHVDRAVTKLLGYIKHESEYASLAQDLQTRAALTRGTQKGTIEGEILRSVALFKGFPVAMISRHWSRTADMWQAGGKVSSVAYAAGLGVALTMFGGLALQLKDMAKGKDPRDMTTAKFWAAAFAQGGGAGIFGDMLYTGLGGNARNGAPNWTSLAGPVFGDLFDLGNLTLGNIGQAAAGKDTKLADEALRFGTGHLPFINLWYAKAPIDHAFLNDMREMLSPGTNARMQNAAMKEWGQGYYYKPGEGLPGRGPDLGKAIGE